MTTKKELRRQRDQAQSDLVACGRDLDTLREWSRDVKAAAEPLHALMREAHPGITLATTDVVTLLTSAEVALRQHLLREAEIQQTSTPIRVVTFPRGVSLHRLIGTSGIDTACGRTATPSMRVSTLDDWSGNSLRCSVCFRSTNGSE